jgi:hypothetical protein
MKRIIYLLLATFALTFPVSAARYHYDLESSSPFAVNLPPFNTFPATAFSSQGFSGRRFGGFEQFACESRCARVFPLIDRPDRLIPQGRAVRIRLTPLFTF